jgi:hypothetical protein
MFSLSNRVTLMDQGRLNQLENVSV